MENRIGALLLVVLGLAPGMVAAQVQQLTPEDWVIPRMNGFIRSGRGLDEARNYALKIFHATDIDGGGVSERDYALTVNFRAAAHRAGTMNTWLRLDLDGDGKMTRLEAEQFFGQQARQPIVTQGVLLMPTSEQVAKTMAKLVGDAMKPDVDDDGVVTFAELLAYAEQQRVNRSQGVDVQRSVPMALDLNNDGIVTEEEYMQVVERALVQIDSNGDNVVSPDEAAMFQRRMHEVSRTIALELARKKQ